MLNILLWLVVVYTVAIMTANAILTWRGRQLPAWIIPLNTWFWGIICIGIVVAICRGG